MRDWEEESWRYLTDSDDKGWQYKYSHSHPGDICFKTPRLSKVAPAFKHPRGHLWPREDKHLRANDETKYLWANQKKQKTVRNDLRQFTPYLRHTEHKGQAPRNHNGSVPAGGCTSPIRLQGAADGIVPIHSHGNNHVGGCKHPDDLQILDRATQSVRALEVLCDVPHQLWQHLGTK